MAKTILIADDNPAIRRTLCELFELEEGYDLCAEAANGREAIDLALKHHPDLIILDLSMPVMTGLVAARELKKLLPHTPIILYTQFADLGKHMLGRDAPVDLVVAKSDPKELIRHVKSLISV